MVHDVTMYCCLQLAAAKALVQQLLLSHPRLASRSPHQYNTWFVVAELLRLLPAPLLLLLLCQHHRARPSACSSTADNLLPHSFCHVSYRRPSEFVTTSQSGGIGAEKVVHYFDARGPAAR
eukprot:GHUV01020563.1.p2 GENE.GHUV01020563.1~~GHUV01020563.1.p2  ORF type:complete len:121 (-),score=11.38 GHUV01020563.1:95-457(-)